MQTLVWKKPGEVRRQAVAELPEVPREVRHALYAFLESIGAVQMGEKQVNRRKVFDLVENYSRVKNALYLQQINDMLEAGRRKYEESKRKGV